MIHSTTKQTVLFEDLADRPLSYEFDQEAASSDGGAILLKAAERRMDLIRPMISRLCDARQSGKVAHTLEELLRGRVFALATGYEDGNDAARLKDDAIHKLLVGRDPIDGDALASQSTLSRFENSVGPKDLYRMGETLADRVIERQRRRLYAKKVREITVDVDSTPDPTYGEQQLALFNGKYRTHCYQPMLGFVRFNEEAEQYLVAALLRAGNASAKAGGMALVKRLVAKLRRAFPGARIVVRLDAGFVGPEIYDTLEALRVGYVVAIPANQVLKEMAEEDQVRAREMSESIGTSFQVFGEGEYQAKTWSRSRRVIWKAEVTRYPGREPRDNPRFVVTNLEHN